jgi:epoxyqueuosine reductase
LSSLTHRLKAEAHSLGFELVGIAPAVQAPGWDRFNNWLQNGYAGEMEYLEQGAGARQSLDAVLPGTKSIVMLAISYHQPEVRQQETPVNHGRVASYALGTDYHPFLWNKLNRLSVWLTAEVPDSHSRGVVDTAPVLERDYARLAGLGWFGKNTMLINKRMGSFLLLASLLTTVELEIDPPHVSSHCGTCTACLDACPTDAFPEPGTLDATKCISYFTIEKRGSIPLEMREKFGDWFFGCDICQDVCPWNRKAPQGQGSELLSADWHDSDSASIDLLELLKLDDAAFKAQFRSTALWRSKKQGLIRNACIVLGNRGDGRAIPILELLTQSDDEVIREAAQWALKQLTKTIQPPAL